MGNIFQQQVRVVDRDKIRSSTTVMEAAFFDENGDPLTVGFTPAATVAAIATPDGSDAGTTQTLANATKVKVNDLIAKLKSAGIIAS